MQKKNTNIFSLFFKYQILFASKECLIYMEDKILRPHKIPIIDNRYIVSIEFYKN